jgi:acetyltransferase
MASAQIKDILYPDSIAIVGASRDQTKRGYRSIEKLLGDGYAGAIYPVNPKESEILGLPCYARLDEVPGQVDLVLVCTPAKTLPDVMRQCGAKGVKGAVVLAGGFAEAGEEGARLQDAMVAAAREAGVRIIGPNTSGIFNTHKSCNIVGFANLRRGGIGLLSQSGNMALSLVTEAEANGHVGLSTYIGIGNESDIRFDEYLDYFADDPNTSVVVAYVEGVKQGGRFLRSLRALARRKPVVIYKSGRTKAGINSAKSHTGALAGDYAVSDGVLRQAGAVLARKSDEIISLAEALSLLPPPRTRRVAVLADGGGHATIAADVLTEHGMTLAPLAAFTRAKLAALLPAAAALDNPIDVAGGTDANPALFADCARILLEDGDVDALLITGLYGGYGVRFSQTLTAIEMETSERIAKLRVQTGKPILVHSLYGNLYADLRPQPLSLLRQRGIPVYESLERAVRCLQGLAEAGEASVRGEPSDAQPAVRGAGFERVLATCREEGRSVVLEHEARAALAEAGVGIPPSLLCHDAAGAVCAFRQLGAEPVAMKIVSRDIIHKSEAGGVILGLADEDAIRQAFARITDNARRHDADARVAGVLVTPMAAKGGVEIIIGVVRDPTYGLVMMFGLGGILVEVLKDVVFRALPLTRGDAHAMLSEIRASRVLDGVRGAPPVDREALVDLMMGVSALCSAFPEIEELDLNPVMAYASGATVLDARILLADTDAEVRA